MPSRTLKQLKTQYAKLVARNATKTANCRNTHCITPKIKKYCRSRKNYRKSKPNQYTDCFLSNALEMRELGLYEGMPECTQKHGCYNISKARMKEMMRLEKEMEQT